MVPRGTAKKCLAGISRTIIRSGFPGRLADLPIKAVAPLRDVNDRNEGLIVLDVAIDAIIEQRSDRVTARPRYPSRDR